VRPEAELRARFAGLDDRPVVCSCGTGVTACVLAFALHRLGRDDVAVYDGSWTEWAGRDDTPIETDDGQCGGPV
jgi:thiosulfate/3-mercaptopyruvate sulfurtransferase